MGDDGRPDRSDDLRATADSIAEDAEQLAALERAKADLPPSDPATVDLSDTALELAERMRREAAAEDALAREAREEHPPRPN